MNDDALFEVDVAGDSSVRQSLTRTSRKSTGGANSGSSAREKKRKLLDKEKQLAALVFEVANSATPDEVDYDASRLVVSTAYHSFVLDEDGEISRNWAEYDPSQLTTKIAGDIEDELDFSEIANKIASDDSNSVKLEAFVNELLENNIPCVFVNTKLKLITQIYLAKLKENLI